MTVPLFHRRPAKVPAGETKQSLNTRWAQLINERWADCGLHANARLVPRNHGNATGYVLASDLVDGVPRTIT